MAQTFLSGGGSGAGDSAGRSWGQEAPQHPQTQRTLEHWIDLLRRELGGEFPEQVTAFRPEMAVHGRFGKACPVCGGLVQRIRYAENKTNYCPRCQTSGRLLADCGLSQLLREDWPRTVEELENLRNKARES